MAVLKRLIVVVAIVALHLQPSLQASTNQIYDNLMLTGLQNTDNYKGNYYQNAHIAPGPYFWHKKMYKTAANMKDGVVDVAKDVWRDMNNNKLGYIFKMVGGTSAGALGGLAAGPIGVVVGGLFGLSVGTAVQYTERRYFSDEYLKQKEEWRKKEEAKRKEHAEKMHRNMKHRPSQHDR